jgi:hypothetical protein
MDYEPGLCGLVRVIDLTLIALVEPEADAHIVQVALENAQRMAADLNSPVLQLPRATQTSISKGQHLST